MDRTQALQRMKEIVGPKGVVGESDEAAYLNIYLKKHPYLKDFVNSPTCALVLVRVDTYFLVRRFQEVSEIHVKDWK